MANRTYRPRTRRQVLHATDAGTESSVGTTQETWASMVPKTPVGTGDRNPGGTIVRQQVKLRTVSGSATSVILRIWAVVGKSDMTVSDIPNPWVTGNLNQYANYLFADQVHFTNGTVISDFDLEDKLFGNWDVKAMRRLNDDEKIFLMAQTVSGTASFDYINRFWWKEPAA